jgi:RNA polymerase sigma-70 factor (ECF subfamily)
VRVVLDEEINRLPSKYRLPFILCYLDGKSNEQAAAQLTCPVGTLASRLAWARKRLQVRLTRRGITLSAGFLASALAADGLAAVPTTLAEATIHGAVRFALGKVATAGSISADLAREYIHGVLRANVLKGAAVVLIVGLGIAFVVWWLTPRPAGPVGGDTARPLAAPAPRDDLKQFQGDWLFVNLEINGQAVPPGNTRMIFGAGECKILDAGGTSLPMTFRLDPTQEPKTIDLEYSLNNDKVSGRGIYRLEGDRLTICYHFDKSENLPRRPSEFVTHPAAQEMLFSLQREKADPRPNSNSPAK